MPRTIESIVHNHQVARARRKAGRPVWDKQIPVRKLLGEYSQFGDELAPAQAVEFCGKLFSLLSLHVPKDWRKFEDSNTHWSYGFEEVMERLEFMAEDDCSDTDGVTPADVINEIMDELYDWADAQRVWFS